MIKNSVRIRISSIALIGIVSFFIYLMFSFVTSRNNQQLLEDLHTVYFPVLERVDANMVRLDKIKEMKEWQKREFGKEIVEVINASG